MLRALSALTMTLLTTAVRQTLVEAAHVMTVEAISPR